MVRNQQQAVDFPGNRPKRLIVTLVGSDFPVDQLKIQRRCGDADFRGQQFLTGRWDPLADLLSSREDVLACAARVPYLEGWGVPPDARSRS